MSYNGSDLAQVARMTFTTNAPTVPIYIIDGKGSQQPLPFGIEVAIEKKDGTTASLSLPEWKLK